MADVTREARPNKLISTRDHETRFDGTLPNSQNLGSHGDDSIFGASALLKPLPKCRLPASESRPGDIYRVVLRGKMAMDGLDTALGEWAYSVGLPGKSGDGILAALPGKLAVTAFSRSPDPVGNNVRGQLGAAFTAKALMLNRFASPSSDEPGVH